MTLHEELRAALDTAQRNRIDISGKTRDSLKVVLSEFSREKTKEVPDDRAAYCSCGCFVARVDDRNILSKERKMDKARKQIDTLFEKARERGLRPMWTHYHREDYKGRRALGATTCLLLDSEGNVVSRGATVVSTKDIPSKAFGRALSLKRAYGAAVGKTPSNEAICTWGVDEDYGDQIGYLDKFILKAQKNPLMEDLSDVEVSRLTKRDQEEAAVAG